MQHINNVTFFIYQCLSRIVMFIEGYVALHRSSRVMSHCNISQELATLQQCPRCDTWLMWHLTLIKGYVTLWCLSGVLFHCVVLQGLCHIAALVKGYAALQQCPRCDTLVMHHSMFRNFHVALWSKVNHGWLCSNICKTWVTKDNHGSLQYMLNGDTIKDATHE